MLFEESVKELIIDIKLKDVKFKSYCYPDKFIEHGSVNELEEAARENDGKKYNKILNESGLPAIRNPA
mgnify:CR=1 FL=1